MEHDEYLKLAEVEDQMWYFHALHAHVRRELEAELGRRGNPAHPADAARPQHLRMTEGGGNPRLLDPRSQHPQLPHTGAQLRILDAGCGTGGLMRRLGASRPEWRWTGVDLSPVACELARRLGARQGGHAEIREASVTGLPFAAGSFDAVVSADVLYHVDDDMAALREFFRVLRPGGVVVLNVPAYRWLWSYHDEAVHSRRRYTRGEMLEKLRTAGGGDARATYWNTLPLPLIVVRRKLLPAPKGGSDVRLYPPVIEAAFNTAMALEGAWIRGVGRLPFGSSVLAVARKPG